MPSIAANLPTSDNDPPRFTRRRRRGAQRLRIRSAADLLAVVPYLLGFHPTDSLVVVAMRREGAQLPDWPEPDSCAAAADAPGFAGRLEPGTGIEAPDTCADDLCSLRSDLGKLGACSSLPGPGCGCARSEELGACSPPPDPGSGCARRVGPELCAGQVVFVARSDLPGQPASRAALAAIADRIAGVVLRQGVHAAAVIGYGPAARVQSMVAAVHAALSDRGVAVCDALRVTAGRYWSFLCTDPGCCPPEGTPFDVTTSPLAAAAVFAGQAVLPDRAALVRQVSPVGGPARESMCRATEDAVDRLAELVASVPAGHGRAAVARAGESAVRAALDRYRAGGRLTDGEMAWLTLLLSDRQVRDFAWKRSTVDDWQLALWTDVVCRAEPDLAPAPASLLAFAAWRSGYGALASVALDRALQANPAYSMARLLEGALRDGISPAAVDGWPWTDRRPGGGAPDQRRADRHRRNGHRRRASRRTGARRARKASDPGRASRH